MCLSLAHVLWRCLCLSSPQVAGVPRFRFGPPEDMIPQTSSSHSDLGQLASQGGEFHKASHDFFHYLIKCLHVRYV